MPDIRRFRRADQVRTRRRVSEARQLLLSLDGPPEALAALRAGLDAIDRASEGYRYMQVNDEREAEILAYLDAHAREPGTAARVLVAVRRALGFVDQRTTLTQAEIAERLGLRPTNAAKAFRVLAEAGAILDPQPHGRSRTWAVDATFATRLGSDLRAAAAAQQARLKAGLPSSSSQAAPPLRLVIGGMDDIA